MNPNFLQPGFPSTRISFKPNFLQPEFPSIRISLNPNFLQPEFPSDEWFKIWPFSDFNLQHHDNGINYGNFSFPFISITPKEITPVRKKYQVLEKKLLIINPTDIDFKTACVKKIVMSNYQEVPTWRSVILTKSEEKKKNFAIPKIYYMC